MKVKTSVTLSEDLLSEVDRAAGSESRSAFIERVLRGFLRRSELLEEQENDRAILDRGAGALNEEAADVMAYQASWPGEAGYGAAGRALEKG